MRCNRKTACLAVTPLKKMVVRLNITEIWQLRRREKAKRKLLPLFLKADLTAALNRLFAFLRVKY